MGKCLDPIGELTVDEKEKLPSVLKEMNLSGAHAPCFTRNIGILTDSGGAEGVGGKKITQVLQDVEHLVVGTRSAGYKQTENKVRAWLGGLSLPAYPFRE